MMLTKKLFMINWSPKSILLILRYGAMVDQSLKHSIIQTNNVLEKIEHADKKTHDNITITDTENEISSITGLVTTAAFNAKV